MVISKKAPRARAPGVILAAREAMPSVSCGKPAAMEELRKMMTMSWPELIVLIVIAAICGAVARALAGSIQGGLVTSTAIGFIGSLFGPWLAEGVAARLASSSTVTLLTAVKVSATRYAKVEGEAQTVSSLWARTASVPVGTSR